MWLFVKIGDNDRSVGGGNEIMHGKERKRKNSEKKFRGDKNKVEVVGVAVVVVKSLA